MNQSINNTVKNYQIKLTINDPISNVITPAINEMRKSGFEAGPPRPEIGINVEKKNIVKYEKYMNGKRCPSKWTIIQA